VCPGATDQQRHDAAVERLKAYGYDEDDIDKVIANPS
jgi:hypothetical protein